MSDVIIHTSKGQFCPGFGVEVEGIRNAWPCRDLQATAEAFVSCAEWLRHVATLSEEEKAALRQRSS